MEWDEYFFEMCKLVSQKSKDLHTKAGCVIVGPDNEVRSTGYNGFPRGVIDSVNLDIYRLGLFPEGMWPTREQIVERFERPEKYVWTEHAERNGIYAAARVGVPLKGCRIYVTGMPCCDCARAIIQSGIEDVYIDKYDQEYIEKNNEKYRFDATKEMFNESGVRLHYNSK